MHNNKDIDFQHDAEVKVNAIGSFKFYNLNVGHVKTPSKALFWPQIQYKYTLSQSIDFISPDSSLKNFIPQQIFGSLYTKYNATKINSYAESSNSLRYVIDKKNHTINYTLPIIWSPLGCLPSLSSAIIIPYRKREQHLRVLTDHLHGFLRHQRIPYTIFIIEQTGETKFNRGALLNAGFLEVSKFKEYDCFILHDVDKLPEDDRIIYTCGPNPTHLSASLSTFNYNRPQEDGERESVVSRVRIQSSLAMHQSAVLHAPLAIDLPILVFTPASGLPPSSIMLLTRYVKDSTYVRAFPSCVTEFVSSVVCLRNSFIPSCMLRLTATEDAATLVVLT
ncbi:unnamed protein product [Schistosoma curassoni]|uniref:Beta-1,4-galactosyltransferase n=1 Tax=Schistosoma curassoni TaxID=6186 RepID=A0A183JI28_9TREM|nr:unnamed protein product [Schistosoma curassoni]